MKTLPIQRSSNVTLKLNTAKHNQVTYMSTGLKMKVTLIGPMSIFRCTKPNFELKGKRYFPVSYVTFP